MKPLLVRSLLGDQVYIATRYTVLHQKENPQGFCTTCKMPFPCKYKDDHIIVASTKYPVSDEMLSAAYLVSIPEEDRNKDEFEISVTRIR
jgi:hypothetical protein